MSGTTNYVWDRHTQVWESGALVAGGSPWRLSRLKDAAADLAQRAHRAGAEGITPTADQPAIITALVDRGWLHPVVTARPGPHAVTVVVPAYGRAEQLRRTLEALAGLPVIVVDDATPLPSAVVDVAREFGATCLRLEENAGPAAARMAGARAATTELVAFVDSDCAPEADWLDRIIPLFDDDRVAVVAPRVVAEQPGDAVLDRYERAASALDMGPHPALVRPGSRQGFVPSAAMVVRRSALLEVGFDVDLRLGEDVDLVWRMDAAGHHVRYEPSVLVRHAGRETWREAILRRRDYGMSAAALEQRHPGHLAPLRVSGWNAALLGSLATGHPVAAGAVLVTSTTLLARRFTAMSLPVSAALRVVGMGVVGDGAAIGHALRREYWPLGASALIASPWSRVARVGAALMVAPLVDEWRTRRPDIDPLRYAALRLASDAAYGVGVTRACVRARTLAPLLPRVRFGAGASRRASGRSSTAAAT